MNIGAIAGFAAIVGLAVLAMLYFSQARDVRRLREWAGREPERAGEVELRAQQIASQAIAQAYESMALRQSEAQAAAGIAQEHGVVPVQEVVVAEQPAATADAQSAGGAEQDGNQLESVAVDEHGNPVGQPQPTEQYDVLAEQGVEGQDVQGQDLEGQDLHGEEVAVDAEHADDAAEQPHEVAASNGAGDTVAHPAPQPGEPALDPAEAARTSHLAPSTPAAARAATPLPPLPPLDTSEFQSVNRPATPPIPDYYLSTEATGSGHFEAIAPPPSGRSRVPYAVAGVLVAVFAVILIGTQLIGGDSDSGSQTATERRDQIAESQPSTGERNQEVNRPAVTISLLNGTPTPGLAKLGADALAKADFTDVTTGNRNDGVNYTTSTVYYASGSKLEAEEVAKELDIKDVKEADDETLAAGGSVPVIVVLGADFDQ